MPDLRSPTLRLAVGLAVAILGIVEVQSFLQTLRAQARLRARLVRSVRESVASARPRIAELLATGAEPAWNEAAREALRSSLASEVEVFDASRSRLLARPGPSPVDHWPGPSDLRALEGGEVLAAGPFAGRNPRILTYASFRSGGERLLLRFSTAVPDFMEDLRERHLLFIGHGVTLLVLLLAAALVLFPATERARAPRRALDAYEEAMGRLRDRGEELSREHEAERRRMEEEIREMEAMARAGELTAGIAHEVRNGLSTIVGYARLLERSGSPPGAAEAARSIREECETLEAVVRRFMDFVKRETLNLAPFDLGRMLSRVVARESRSPGPEVSLPDAEPGTILGDESLLERAFENLVRNAREAAGVGGRVSLRLGREGGAVTVTVADDGPGLPPEKRKELRPFFTTKPGGLGLGLPLALKIVRLHGGELSLGDRAGGGLEVTVRLPGEGPRP